MCVEEALGNKDLAPQPEKHFPVSKWKFKEIAVEHTL